MSQKAKTLDEKFILKVYETALLKENPYAEINYIILGQSMGQKEKAIRNIVKHLAQANLIKKVDDTCLCLTSSGYAFAKSEDL